MKPRSLAVVAALSAALLASGVADAATPTKLSSFPLKASLYAKPTMIFGMDDSGSMDWEVLLNTDSGIAQWSTYTKSAWDSTLNQPLKSSGSNTVWAYLFPTGTATGGMLYDRYSYGFVAPPVRQLAWLRSSKFNPLYYDPSVTYRPWTPATLSGTTVTTFPNANPRAALSHPLYPAGPALDLATDWVSGSPYWTGYSPENQFYVYSGTPLPNGSVYHSPSGTNSAISGNTSVANGAGSASVAWYPATYWAPATCTTGSAVLDCVASPDGVGTLKRYEIRSTVTTYPSGRSYADELQNFANWYTYYRKRKLMLAAAMGTVLDNVSNLRLGVLAFNDNTTTSLSIYDADSTDDTKNNRAAAAIFDRNAMSANATPTHRNMGNILTQFDTNTTVVPYACQRNAMFIVTDGFANASNVSVPSYARSTWGGTQPYATTPTNSLADWALYGYTKRLRAGTLTAGQVPIPTADATKPWLDRNPDLHVNTYAMTLGVRGSMWPGSGYPTTEVDAYALKPAWSTPVADTPSMIDDLWHATVNGRGRMYMASDPLATAQKIMAGLKDFQSQVGAQSAVAVSNANLVRSDGRSYAGAYNAAGWTGDLLALTLDKTTGTSSTPIWSAAQKLEARDWTTRTIISSTSRSGNGAAFVATNAALASQVNPSGIYGSNADVFAFLRGDRTNQGTTMRARTGRMGAVINAEPVIDPVAKVAYVPANDGYVHAFDIDASTANDGQELWAYAPNLVLGQIGAQTGQSYVFSTLVDATPTLATLPSGTKMLIGGLGASGKGYYALDVTNPRPGSEATAAASLPKWEFPQAADTATVGKVGATLGKPRVVRLPDGTVGVLVSSGYNNADGRGFLWLLDPANGAILKEFVTPDAVGTVDQGLSSFTPLTEADGSVRYVYAGDMYGNLWRFDLTATIAANAVTKLAVLRSATGAVQPVTTAPDLVLYKGMRLVYVATGRLLSSSDFGTSAVNSLYVIADGTPITGTLRSVLMQQAYTPPGSTSTSVRTVDWKSQRGWYVDFPAGEQVSVPVRVQDSKVFVATNKAGLNDCTASSYLYVYSALDGNFIDSAVISSQSNVVGMTVMRGDGNGPNGDGNGNGDLIVDPRLNDTTSQTRRYRPSSTLTASKNSWRDVRR